MAPSPALNRVSLDQLSASVRSLKEFSSELIKGETRLLQVPSGILVITEAGLEILSEAAEPCEVVMMILSSQDKETLMQTGQAWNFSLFFIIFPL